MVISCYPSFFFLVQAPEEGRIRIRVCDKINHIISLTILLCPPQRKTRKRKPPPKCPGRGEAPGPALSGPQKRPGPAGAKPRAPLWPAPGGVALGFAV